MISFFLFVCLFTFVTCRSFHANQHLPVQKFQPPLRYQPYDYYPNVASAPSIQTLPYYRPSPTKEGITVEPTQQQLDDLERQYQQWQIAVPNGQQPGVVWISAPQYSYYPPPSGSPPNYPPPPYYPSPYPPPYPIPAPQSNQTQSEIQEINPTQARETINPPTRPNPPETTAVDYTTPSENITLSPIETVPTSSPSSEPPTTPSPTTPSSTYSPTTPSPTTLSSTFSPSTPSTYPPTTESTTLPSVENSTYISSTTQIENVTTTTESTTNATTAVPSTESTTPIPSPTTTQNSTSVETTTAPQNTTSNSTNPLLKYCKKPRGQFPGKECSKFVNCWDDTAIEQACPSGLYFNANKSYCDYPENVECSDGGIVSSTEQTSSSSSPSSSNTTSKCPSSYGTYRNSSNCAAFYVCVAGEPVDFYCPPGTNYNDELKVCDYPYRVNCSGIPSYPIPEESVTTIATETTPSNSTSNSTTPSNTTTPYTTTPYTTTPYTTESPVYVTSSPSNVTSSPNTTVSYTTTESINSTESISTLPPPQVTEEPSFPPPSVDPVALYNYNLKKLPESVVNTGVRCYHSNIFRLTPDCSSVTVCQDGLTYIVNCGHATSFDAYSQKCVPTFRARC